MPPATGILRSGKQSPMGPHIFREGVAPLDAAAKGASMGADADGDGMNGVVAALLAAWTTVEMDGMRIPEGI